MECLQSLDKGKEADLMERQQNYEKKAYEAETKLQQKEQELLQAIMIKVNTAVQDLAKDEGYSYIFERTTLLQQVEMILAIK